MKCRKCGEELLEGASFCIICGTKISAVCENCGTELPDVARFCPRCGNKVKSAEVTEFITGEELLQLFHEEDMKQLSQIKEQAKPTVEEKYSGAPVWDTTSSGGELRLCCR